jgi:hypothetical protein
MSESVNHSPIHVAKGVRETVNQDGAVLLDIEQGLCFSLNPVGTKIWEMIKAGRSVNEIADSLEAEFHLPRSQFLQDIADFLGQLQEMKLVGEKSEVAEKPGTFSRFLGRRRSAHS